MIRSLVVYLLVIWVIAQISFSCTESYVPKPRGYFRIDFPERFYINFSEECPYSFNYPSFAEIVRFHDQNNYPCWINIELSGFKGTIHISYLEIENELSDYIEDSRKLAYKHSIRADAIDEMLFINEGKRVFGTLYDIKGNSASSIQFYLTDSTNHFFRGALYFNVSPNYDSLSPVIEYFREDVVNLIETFSWN